MKYIIITKFLKKKLHIWKSKKSLHCVRDDPGLQEHAE